MLSYKTSAAAAAWNGAWLLLMQTLLLLKAAVDPAEPVRRGPHCLPQCTCMTPYIRVAGSTNAEYQHKHALSILIVVQSHHHHALMSVEHTGMAQVLVVKMSAFVAWFL